MAIDPLAASVSEAQAESAELRAALLHAAFTGTLVPQNPSDEPASALLDRIRAGRATAKKAPRKPRSARKPSERFRAYEYDELIARDKVNLDLTVLQSASASSASLAPPDVIAQEIVEDLETALAEFTAVAQALKKAASSKAADSEPITETEAADGSTGTTSTSEDDHTDDDTPHER